MPLGYFRSILRKRPRLGCNHPVSRDETPVKDAAPEIGAFFAMRK
jgi:hypothetical protein